jgi:DNA invertase Pin-like site-specific DNA recombinase
MLENYIKPTPKRRRKIAEAVIDPSQVRRVFYARGSREDINKSNQISEFKNAYPDLVHEIIEETDQGDGKREKLELLLTTLPPGSVIHVAALDRISRSIVDLDKIMKLCEERKISIKSAREGDLDTMNPTIVKMLGVIAEMEKRHLSERTKRGIKRAKEEKFGGNWGNGIIKARAKAAGKRWKKPAGRSVKPEFKEAIPLLKKLRKKGMTLAEIAVIASQVHRINFTVPNVSNLLNYGHG